MVDGRNCVLGLGCYATGGEISIEKVEDAAESWESCFEDVKENSQRF
jgi:hypothetical protein